MDDGIKFKDYVKEKRLERNITLRGLADALGIAPSYMSDIEKGKRNAPSKEILDKMVNVLFFNEDEKYKLYDLAAMDKNTIAQDIADYVNINEVVRIALRKANELNFSEKDWYKVLEEIENKRK